MTVNSNYFDIAKQVQYHLSGTYGSLAETSTRLDNNYQPTSSREKFPEEKPFETFIESDPSPIEKDQTDNYTVGVFMLQRMQLALTALNRYPQIVGIIPLIDRHHWLRVVSREGGYEINPIIEETKKEVTEENAEGERSEGFDESSFEKYKKLVNGNVSDVKLREWLNKSNELAKIYLHKNNTCKRFYRFYTGSKEENDADIVRLIRDENNNVVKIYYNPNGCLFKYCGTNQFKIAAIALCDFDLEDNKPKIYIAADKVHNFGMKELKDVKLYPYPKEAYEEDLKKIREATILPTTGDQLKDEAAKVGKELKRLATDVENGIKDVKKCLVS